MTPALGALLVVDDDEYNRDLLCRRLARKGYAATAAASGQEALALLQEHPAPSEFSGIDRTTLRLWADVAYTADEPADYWNERGYSRYDGL